MSNIIDLSVQFSKRYNKEKDIPFRRIMHDSIMQARALIMQQTIDRYGNLPYEFYTTIDSIKLEQASISKNTVSSGSTKLQRESVEKLPRIISIKNNQRIKPAIKYLGNINKTEAYTYILPSRFEYITKGDKFTDLTNYYSIVNDKIITYNKSRKFITIEAAFFDLDEVNRFANNHNLQCTGGFEISDAIVAQIKQIIFAEFDTNKQEPENIELNE